jgi:hypothetical protein
MRQLSDEGESPRHGIRGLRSRIPQEHGTRLLQRHVHWRLRIAEKLHNRKIHDQVSVLKNEWSRGLLPLGPRSLAQLNVTRIGHTGVGRALKLGNEADSPDQQHTANDATNV